MSNPELAVVHPLVLLSVVDHYKRVVAKSKNKRVAGILLGWLLKNFALLILFLQANGIKEPLILPIVMLFLLKKTLRSLESGSWITSITRICLKCTERYSKIPPSI